MQAYELWKLEQDAKLIIKEMDKIESKPADDNWKLLFETTIWDDPLYFLWNDLKILG